MFAILLGKFITDPSQVSAFDEALVYLEQNKLSFGIELDYMKVRINALITLKNSLEKPDSKYHVMLIKDLLCVIQSNFKDIENF